MTGYLYLCVQCWGPESTPNSGKQEEREREREKGRRREVERGRGRRREEEGRRREREKKRREGGIVGRERRCRVNEGGRKNNHVIMTHKDRRYHLQKN